MSRPFWLWNTNLLSDKQVKMDGVGLGVGMKRAVVATNSCNTIQTLLDINAMIDIHAKHLEGLR